MNYKCIIIICSPPHATTAHYNTIHINHLCVGKCCSHHIFIRPRNRHIVVYLGMQLHQMPSWSLSRSPLSTVSTISWPHPSGQFLQFAHNRQLARYHLPMYNCICWLINELIIKLKVVCAAIRKKLLTLTLFTQNTDGI